MEYIGSEKFHPGDAKWQGFESSQLVGSSDCL